MQRGLWAAIDKSPGACSAGLHLPTQAVGVLLPQGETRCTACVCRSALQLKKPDC